MSHSFVLPAALAAGLLALLSAEARADVITIGSSKDNTLYNDIPGGLSNGSGMHFFAGRNNDEGSIRRGVIEFDVAGSLPAGSTITGVSLDLYMSRTQAGPQTVGVHLAFTEWGEGASDALGEEGGGALPEPGDATWLHTFYPGSFWPAPGGDFAGPPSATKVVDGLGHYVWSSSQMVADVQTWVDDDSLNHGWFIIGGEPVGGQATAKRFDTHENDTPSRRPQLTITFDPPPITGACCFSDGTCTVATPVDCAAQGGLYQGDGVSCSPNPCPQPMGACCLSDGTCQTTSLGDCIDLGGTWQGEGVTCLPDPCPMPLVPYVDALPIPAVAQPYSGTPGGAADYQIAMTQFQQQLHRDLPPTTLWGYGGTFPGPTIEASTDNTVTVDWINDLKDAQGNPLQTHYLTVDPCPHGAADLPKTVVHLHGTHAPSEFDGQPEATYLPGYSDTYLYPNKQLPATLWYHDHALGITRLNVYMGLAGFYIVRDPFELALGLPAGADEIPLVVQDRSFHPDGSLKYPAVWQEHFFGDTILVNGKVWPYLNVKQGKVRFRLLNGSNSRTCTFALSNGATFQQIGTDGGLLPAPVDLTAITLAPAERADLVIDFEGYAPGTEILLTNSAPAPYPGTPGVGVVPDVMKFVVGARAGHTAPVPSSLRPLEVLEEVDASVHREFELKKFGDPCTGSTWLINGLAWNDITERPLLGDTEVWGFINRSGMMHPMHMHLVMFQVLDRQPFTVVMGDVVPSGPPVPPAPEEAGWKDTVKVHPNEIVRVIARFTDYTGRFPYHCHILEHEDHEMMRQFEVVPVLQPPNPPLLRPGTTGSLGITWP